MFMFHVCFYAVLSVLCSLVITCWDRVDLLVVLCLMIFCVLSLSNMMAWVRYGENNNL